MKTCSTCRAEKPEYGFSPDIRHTDGRSARCKECSAKAHAVYRAANPAIVAEIQRRSRTKNRLAAFAILGGRCVICGDTDQRVLEIDHPNNDGKAERAQYGSTTSLYQRIVRGKRQIEDLRLLCANDHAIVTYNREEEDGDSR